MCDFECGFIRNVKYGFSTGICAAAASKASAIFQASGKIPDFVTVKNLENHEFNIRVFSEKGNFYVIKDSGNDRSDVTNGIKIFSHVEILADNDRKIFFSAGEGVGIVTLPGLKIPIGEPAINPIPRKIIENSLREIIPEKSLRVTISIPDGEKIALKTFNPRLGIKNGLSILGTSGFVKPMNEKALLDSLTLELNMIKSLGFSEIFITFGNEGEKSLRKLFNLTSRNVIQTGNYIGHVLDEAANLNFTHATIAGHAGKLLKVAAGSFNTHNKISDGRLEALCTHLALAGASRDLISKVFHSNTTLEAIEIVNSNGFNFIWNNIEEVISKKCEERTFGKLKIDTVILDSCRCGERLGNSFNARS